VTEPQIVKVREKKYMWEVVTLYGAGQHRYSYWGKNIYPDELAAYTAAQKMLDGETNGCDFAPTLPK
jgi:hypothetical protein